MSANGGSIIDQLVVELVLSDEPYRKSSKKIDATVDATEKKLQRNDKKQKERDRQRIKQNADVSKSFKALSSELGRFAAGVGAVLGVGGGAAGLVALVTNFAGLQNGMTKLGVATGLSNRELVSWGTAAKSLGASAESAQGAIAALAREQQAMRSGHGVGPQLAALSSIGVRIGPNTSVVDALGQAQAMLRNMPEGQRNGAESRLATQGVSADVLAMLKSERDIRETYAQAYAETAEENKKAVSAVNDALSSLGTFATNAGNALTQIFQPQIEAAADWLKRASTSVSQFVTDVAGAGGGVKGFTSVLEQRIPGLDKSLETFGDALDVIANTMDVIAVALKKAFGWVDKLFAKVFPQADGGSPIAKGFGIVGDALKWFWGESVSEAHANGHRSFSGVALTPDAQARSALDDGETGITSTLAAPRAQPAGSNGPKPGAGELVDMLVAKGLSLPQAVGMVANMQAESSLNPGAISKDGGAAGYTQLRGPRRKAFKDAYGFDVSQATPQQQIDFMFSNRDERTRLNKALAAAQGGAATDYARSISTVFETPSLTAAGLAAEAERRAALVAGIGVPRVISARAVARSVAAQQATAPGAAAGGPTYNIANVNVSANNPQQFSDGMQRVSNTSSYGSAVR